MKTYRREFKKDFLWGSATSAYQVEGAAFSYGKAASQQDILSENSLFCTTETASDHYHHMEEDVKLMKELGLKTYRFSMSWPRIFPAGRGEPNPEGVKFYHQLIDALCEAGIVPIVTMYHYDLPWKLVEEYGGWLNRKIVDDFANYAAFLVKEYGDKVKHWITINEQNIIYRMWTRKNYIPEELQKDEKLRYQMNHHYTMAHAAACRAVRAIRPDVMLSGVPAVEPAYPRTSSPADCAAAAAANMMRNYFFIDPYMKGSYPVQAMNYLEDQGLMFRMEPGDEALMKEGCCDFLAVNYYHSVCAKACEEDAVRADTALNLYGIKGSATSFETAPGLYTLCKNPLLETTDWDWPIDAEGFSYALTDLYERYGKPMMIAENGLGARDILTEDGRVHDDYRIAYLRKHIDALHDAVDKGVDLFAYCVWSFMDLMSTSNGYEKRYGLVYVNREDKDLKDLARIKKDSYYWYQHVIATNGRDL